MKKYIAPTVEDFSLSCEDVVTASGILNGIVSAADREGAAETQESSWNDAWN